MFEVTTTYTRRNTNDEFFAFQIENVNLLRAHTVFRREMSDAPGFIGISYILSNNKLGLRVQVLWESQNDLDQFTKSSKYRDVFFKLAGAYNDEKKITVSVDFSQTLDPKYLKTKKLSERMTIKEGQQRLIDFITNLKAK